MTQLQRGEVQPNAMYDDATALVLRCPRMDHEARLVLVQSERRGSLDDETIDTTVVPLTSATLKRLRMDAAVCPDLANATCTCPWHTACAVDAATAPNAPLRRLPDAPYIAEDDSDESNIWHYGRTA